MTVQRDSVAAFQCLGVGDPVTDVLANVRFETMSHIDGAAGGCSMVDRDELSALRAVLARECRDTQQIPGGSAANVVTCISRLTPSASCQCAPPLPSASCSAWPPTACENSILRHVHRATLSQKSPNNIKQA
jgi:hypothetical protein